MFGRRRLPAKIRELDATQGPQVPSRWDWEGWSPRKLERLLSTLQVRTQLLDMMTRLADAEHRYALARMTAKMDLRLQEINHEMQVAQCESDLLGVVERAREKLCTMRLADLAKDLGIGRDQLAQLLAGAGARNGERGGALDTSLMEEEL